LQVFNVLSLKGKNQRNFKKTMIAKRPKGPKKKAEQKMSSFIFCSAFFLGLAPAVPKPKQISALAQLVDKVIDKLLRTVEKDADFVFRGSSAYKGTTETRKTKSKKPPILRRFSRLNHKQLHTPPFQM